MEKIDDFVMKDIAIFGAGGLGKEVACLIRRINQEDPKWNLIGFFDDNPAINDTQISHFGKCLGGVDELNSYPKELALVLAIGNSTSVKNVVDRIHNDNVTFPNLIHPNFAVTDPESFEIGKGNIIQGGCSATCDVHIGSFNVLNGDVVIGHDVVIGDYNTFMPATRISGGVRIGELNFFGVSSIVIQQIKIGNQVRLAAGSVLMTKPKDGFMYLGVPARKTEF